MTMKVAIRADASVPIGSGHVMRCLSLAIELQRRDVQVVFVCRDLPVHLGELILSHGFRLHRLLALAASSRVQLAEASSVPQAWLGLSWQTDCNETHAALDGSKIDWLIVDHYGLDAKWESAMRTVATRIMVIDDLADRMHDCDLLLDQNVYDDMEQRYSHLVPPSCRKLLGPRFALLRQEFSRERARARIRDGAMRKILVFLGDADSTNITTKVMRAVKSLARSDIKYDVVIGASNPNTLEIELLSKDLPNMTLSRQVSNMAELMTDADLCIGAGGTTMWERFCMGLPSIVIPIAANQFESAQALARMGKIFCVTDDGNLEATLVEAIRTLIGNRPYQQFLAQMGAELVDGRGAVRVAGRLIASQIVMRRACIEDTEQIFTWRNAQVTRRYSFDPNPITRGTHQEWFRRAVADSNTVILIGELNGAPIGVARFDLIAIVATVSVYLVPEYHGQGLGTALLEAGADWMRRAHPDIRILEAHIRTENTSSENAFRDAGYRCSSTTFQKTLFG